ncbi:MAG: hypothetical protein F6K49_48060 [Moorea sp. SIO3I6]|nr:hypothetical protein [Moorena sp. SIO3I6]
MAYYPVYFTEIIYRVFHSNQVHRIFSLLPLSCSDFCAPYSLLPVP